MRCLAVRGRVDVGAAGKKDSVELFVDAAKGLVVHKRNEPRNGAGARESENVSLTHGPRRWNLRRDAAEALQRLRGDADDGSIESCAHAGASSLNRRVIA